MTHHTASQPAASPQVPLGLAGAAVLLLVIFAAAGVDGAIWLVVGLLGLAAAITGWRAGAAQTRGPLLAATAVGAGIAVLVIIWGIFGS